MNVQANIAAIELSKLLKGRTIVEVRPHAVLHQGKVAMQPTLILDNGLWVSFSGADYGKGAKRSVTLFVVSNDGEFWVSDPSHFKPEDR
jgi:hypothetical protein